MRGALLLVAILMIGGVCQAGTLTLARNGQPAATIVLAADPTPSAAFAAAELQYHLGQITGAMLPVVTDEQAVKGPRVLVCDSNATRALQLSGQRYKPEEHLIRFLQHYIPVWDDQVALAQYGRQHTLVRQFQVADCRSDGC